MWTHLIYLTLLVAVGWWGIAGHRRAGRLYQQWHSEARSSAQWKSRFEGERRKRMELEEKS